MLSQTHNAFNFYPQKMLETAIDNDNIPLGYACNNVPRMLLSVGKLFPYRLNAIGLTGGTELADIYLSQVTCSYTRSLLEYAMDDQLEFVQGWIFAAGCDHLRRLYDNLQYILTPDFCYILDVPHKGGHDAISWFSQELKALSVALSDHFQTDINDSNISLAITDHNAMMQSLQNIANFRKNNTPAFSGTEFHRLMHASWTLPIQLMKPVIDKIEKELPERTCPVNDKVRLLVVSSVIDQYEWIEAIENNGALVVADRFCSGAIPQLEICPQTDNPFYDMAAHLLHTNACPRMMDTFAGRLELIIQTVKEYHVDGVIIAPIKFCDIWGVETTQVISFLKEKKIPVLKLERDYSFSGEGQLSTRVQAFIEQIVL
jgi:benzoyl-CoA reductase/2-hydroxyglutaryl-CoA dehydratase subunit BcrC/BadD/HgdB